MSISIFEVNEKSTAEYSGTLKDELGDAIDPLDVNTIVFTLYSSDSPTLAIVNSRNAQRKNTNGGTLASGGAFTLLLGSSDNTILETWRSREIHRGLIDYTWNGGAKRDTKEFMLIVTNRDKVS